VTPVLEKETSRSLCVLVTGSTGFLGKKIVQALSKEGYQVRAFVRRTSNREELKHLKPDFFLGDVADLESLRPAFEGVDFVVHAAADTTGTVEGGKLGTIKGSENILTLCREMCVKKLIYISSCSVYGVANYKPGDVVTETSPLERTPEARGPYSNAKFQAEQVILRAMERNDCPIVCLRPGMIYGPGGEIFPPMMGFSLKKIFFFIIGDGTFILPLVYIDNLVDAITLVIEQQESTGEIYNVVDPYRLSKKEYVNLLLKKSYPSAKFFYIPFTLLYWVVAVQEALMKLIKKKPFLTTYRLQSSQNTIEYTPEKLIQQLHWNPSVPMRQALDEILQHNIQSK